VNDFLHSAGPSLAAAAERVSEHNAIGDLINAMRYLKGMFGSSYRAGPAAMTASADVYARIVTGYDAVTQVYRPRANERDEFYGLPILEDDTLDPDEVRVFDADGQKIASYYLRPGGSFLALARVPEDEVRFSLSPPATWEPDQPVFDSTDRARADAIRQVNRIYGVPEEMLSAAEPTLADTLARIDDALADRCACGCGRPVSDDSPSAWFYNEACQQDWQSRQVAASPPARGGVVPDAAADRVHPPIGLGQIWGSHRGWGRVR